ncbi:MAG: glycosyltransferase [Synergistota bacterium]|nr:glycosyltransferase [Synergistota bacterium]
MIIIKVCHMTTVHKRYDGRILKKECVSLANAGYDVTLLVADNLPDENFKNVKISSIDFSPKNRLDRILNSKKQMLKKALLINADVYHFHDPELIPVGLSLKKKNKKVIYDSHEDYREDIKDKFWIPYIIRLPMSAIFSIYENYAFKKFDCVISVTPHIVNKFKKYNKNTFQITNYPIFVDIDNLIKNNEFKNKNVCFTGLMSPIWMHENIIKAINNLKNIKYITAGPTEGDYLNILKNNDPNSCLKYKGIVPQEKVFEIFKNSCSGIALLNYSRATGFKTGTIGNTKLFEYMMAGLPVICTDFVLWKEIIDKWACGICVSPYDIHAIADAIDFIINDPEKAKAMGDNGQKAVYEEYNWSTQETILLSIYQKISSGILNSDVQ